MSRVEHITGHTWHGRKGALENAFRYGVDYILINPEEQPKLPWLMSRNRFNLTAFFDADNGGAPQQGQGAKWVRQALAANGLPSPAEVLLLSQPRVLGHVFNPVSFWLCYDAEAALRVVIAEVNNTYGDRHSYLVYRDDLAPITAEDRLRARKIFHVSPFQQIEGTYEFRFDIRENRIGIWIDFSGGNGGLIATLVGQRRPASSASILAATLRRPFGSRRVLALIHWQALKLWWKGASFRTRPEPPTTEISR